MGGSKAPITAIAAALFTLALIVPASAAAESPLDAASTVQTVQQGVDADAGPAVRQAASVAQGTTDGPAPAAVRETVERVGRAAEGRAPVAGTRDRVAPTRPDV